MPLSLEDRIAVVFPEADLDDVFRIGPLGSRRDTLIYWRRKKLVSTGMVGTAKGCFVGTLEELEASIERVYGPEGSAMTNQKKRIYAEYTAAVALLRSLPDRD